MSELTLTEKEREQILSQRQKAEREKWVAAGIFVAAEYLAALGDQCAGGSGRQTNPKTGKPFGEEYYHKEELLRHYAANLQSDWRKAL